MNTIKGYRNNSYSHLLRCNATPRLRLHFFRAVGATLAGQYWKNARDNMSTPEVSPLSPGYNVRYPDTKYERRLPVMIAWNESNFRNEEWADECDAARIDHRGWFSDEDCTKTLRAFVYDLPHGRFGCGYADSDSGERVYYLRVFDNVRDAAGFADSEAQHYAEEEQAYNVRWNKVQSLRADEREAVQRLRAYLSARNDDRTAARELAEMEIANVRSIRDELTNDYADIEE
jgi:hypothetical protein